MQAPSILEKHQLGDLKPLYPSWKWLEIPEAENATMRESGARSFYIEQATSGKPKENHFLTSNRAYRIVLKRLIVLQPEHETVEINGGMLRVKWDASDPIKLWVDQRPVPGPMMGKCVKQFVFTASSVGIYKLYVRDARYRAEPIYIRAVEPEANG